MREVHPADGLGSCEWEEGCPGEVIAVVGLPSYNALRVCAKHFDIWVEQEQQRHREQREKRAESGK